MLVAAAADGRKWQQAAGKLLGRGWRRREPKAAVIAIDTIWLGKLKKDSHCPFISIL
jgi:hypothetical protein